jgi:excisionase family DNA binding protein
MTEQTMPPRLLNGKEVSERLAISIRTVAQLTATGELRSCKIARLRRYRPEDVEGFIARNMAGKP